MSLDQIRKKIARNKKALVQKYRIKRIGVFGSYARRENNAKSDLDIVVEFSRTPDIFQFIDLEKALGALLGKKVDLVTKKALKPLIKQQILKETIYL